MSKRAAYIIISVFLAFIAAFFALNLFLPDRDFSEQENRYLQQRPEFSFSALTSGKFTSDFEKYTTDQFTLRDSWTALKARCELALGKRVNNGVYLCDGDRLVEPFTAPAEDTIKANMSYVDKLMDNTDAKVWFGLIPDKSELWGDMLPAGAPNDSETLFISDCYDKTSAETVDLLSPLSERGGEYIYYHTDHHWTSRGAYYGACAILDAMGLPEPQELDIKVVSPSFYGTTWSTSGFSWTSPDWIETWVDTPEGLTVTNYPQGQPVEGTLYDEAFLEKKDKYSFFMGGNSPLQSLVTANTEAPSLLIIRDSYTDSLAPFLLESFSRIDLLDLRYYRASLSDYIEDNGFDHVLVLYSVKNFSTDTNIFLLAR